jgi:hypothetical protein
MQSWCFHPPHTSRRSHRRQLQDRGEAARSPPDSAERAGGRIVTRPMTFDDLMSLPVELLAHGEMVELVGEQNSVKPYDFADLFAGADVVIRTVQAEILTSMRRSGTQRNGSSFPRNEKLCGAFRSDRKTHFAPISSSDPRNFRKPATRQHLNPPSFRASSRCSRRNPTLVAQQTPLW